MIKRIRSLSIDPHAVSLTDRECSLFIDSTTGSIFVDEGDGEDRMNGVVFTARNRPVFSVSSSRNTDCELVLNYCGTAYGIGVFDDSGLLNAWTRSANGLLTAKLKANETSRPWGADPNQAFGSGNTLVK